MSRWKAAGWHLLISVAIGIAVGLLLAFLWYPPPFFRAAGADRLMLILLGVDVVIGPLITLIVFKSGKKGLKFDLTVIGIAQAAALAYGLHVILASRPVFLVAAIDRFELVAANELSPEDLAQGTEPRFRKASWTGPKLVALHKPEDPKERSAALMSYFEGGKDLHHLPRFYVDYANEAAALLARAKPLGVLKAERPDTAQTIDAFTAAQQVDLADLWYLPLRARKEYMIMVLAHKTAEPLGALAVDPWADRESWAESKTEK